MVGVPGAAVTTDLNGRWRAMGASVDAFMEAYQQLPLTEKGASAKAEYDIYADEGLQSCEPMPTPASTIIAAQIYTTEIEVDADTVFLRSEYYQQLFGSPIAATGWCSFGCSATRCGTLRSERRRHFVDDRHTGRGP